MWLTPTAGGNYCCQVTVGPLPLCSQVLLFFCGGGGGGADITTADNHRWTPPPQTKVTIVGKNDIYRWASLVGPFFWYTIFWVPDLLPPAPSLLMSAFGGGGGVQTCVVDCFAGPAWRLQHYRCRFGRAEEC